MFEQAIRALKVQRQKVIKDSQDALGVIDNEISMLEKQSGFGSEKSATRKGSGAAKATPGEFGAFSELWPAIKVLLDRHEAFSHDSAIDTKTLEAELRIGGALTRYKPERAARVPLITVGQHKDEVKYDKRTKKIWLLQK